MPRKSGRPRPSRRKAQRVRPRERSRFIEEPIVARARFVAASESLKILSGPEHRAVELARSLCELTDQSISEVHAACDDEDQVACQSGCTYCCMVPVAASAPEVLAIASFVHTHFDADRRAALGRRVEASIAATEGMDMDQRDRVRLACPFLDEGKCTVYEVRPIACRGTSSYSAEDCREDFEHPATGVELQTNGLRELVFNAIREGLATACKWVRVEHRQLELARAFKIASNNPTLVETWRHRPDAFDPATGASVFPGPWSDELDHEFEQVYQKTINHVEWNQKKG